MDNDSVIISRIETVLGHLPSASLVAGFIFSLIFGLVFVMLYKVLRTPVEYDGRKLFMGRFPVPRWIVKTQNGKIGKPAVKSVLLLTYGTRGDVQPLVALAQEFNKRNNGVFDMTICTTDSFEKFIEDNNVKFQSCGVQTVDQPKCLFDSEKASSFADVVQVLADVYPKLARGMWNACNELKPDLIISQAVVRGIGAQCAEKLRVAHWTVHFAPSNTPTFEFPPSEYTLSKFGVVNKLKYLHRNIEIAKAAIKSGLAKSDEEFRRDILGLPAPLDPLVLLTDLEREPAIHAYSPILQPKPLDWPTWTVVTGACTLEDTYETKQELESSLQSFILGLAAKPIYIGFGSMEGAEKQFRQVVRCVLEELGLNAVICCDAFNEAAICDLIHSTDRATVLKQFKLIRSAPHNLLFPQCALVIHHGGAGTTNAAISAGVPQIILPILAWSDQPFWANVVQRLEVGFRARCSTANENLEFKQSILACLNETMIQQAASGLKNAEHPNGAKIVVDLIVEYLHEQTNSEKYEQ